MCRTEPFPTSSSATVRSPHFNDVSMYLLRTRLPSESSCDSVITFGSAVVADRLPLFVVVTIVVTETACRKGNVGAGTRGTASGGEVLRPPI